MRRPFIAGNWKMYNTISESISLLDQLIDRVKDVKDRDILVGVPYTNIYSVAQKCKGTNILVAAQNMYFEKQGAFTGEISPMMLKEAGAQYVILGHSERRHIFGESDVLINKKVKSALENDIKVILCIGELLEEREAGKVESVIKTQVVEGFKGLTKVQAKSITIAYEPVWAIGTGKTATPQDADDAHKITRDVLAEIYDRETAEAVRIQYGGSVKPDNVDDLMAKPNIDGALVGGASLKADSFARIVKFINK